MWCGVFNYVQCSQPRPLLYYTSGNYNILMSMTNSQEILDEVFNSFIKDKKNAVSTQTPVSTTTTTVFSSTELHLDDEIKREEDNRYRGECLSVSFNKVYGYDFQNDAIPKSERIVMANNKQVLKLIEEQKVFHLNGLVGTFGEGVEGCTKFRVRNVSSLLVKRGLLQVAEWKGRAKRTYGMILYSTNDCTMDDITNYMLYANTVDSLRYAYEEKNKTTAEDVVGHNDEVSRRSKISKIEKKEVARLSKIKEKAKTQLCRCGDSILQHMNKEGECDSVACRCLEFIMEIPRPELN